MIQRLVAASVVLAAAPLTPAGQCTYMPTATATYAPPEVPEAHPAHELTIFHPTVPPPPDTGLYPVLLYSPAAVFAQAESVTATVEQGFAATAPLTAITATVGPLSPGVPPFVEPDGRQLVGAGATANACGFLATAINAGWAIVTAGTTGWDSWPTCSQRNDCNPCQNPPPSDPGCPLTLRCWDTNLWYPPGSGPWNDFNRFWGEKDLLWARQWIGLNGASMSLDTDRVVVCGSSSGAIYAAFLAFGPNRAWGSTYSAQAQQDTRVAGIVIFEANHWLKALRANWGGVHWASSTSPQMECGPAGMNCPGGDQDCFNRRATVLYSGGVGDVADGELEGSAPSRWVRVLESGERPTPTFLATGDGFFTTGFARDANLPAFAADYDRHDLAGAVCGTSTGDPVLIPGDPVLEYTVPPNDLRIHDSWYAVNFKLDLELLDDSTASAFHDNRSRLYLQDGHTWTNLPPCLSTTPNPPMEDAEVTVLDGTFADQGILQSIDNTDLAPRALCWMERELCVERTPGVACRNPVQAGPAGLANANFSIYASDTAFVNVPVPVEVDLNESPGYDQASVLLSSAPYPPGLELVLSGGQVLLCDLAGFLFTTPFVDPDLDGVVRTTLPPANMAGLTFYTQGILLDLQATMPFSLTNSQDITIQP